MKIELAVHNNLLTNYALNCLWWMFHMKWRVKWLRLLRSEGRSAYFWVIKLLISLIRNKYKLLRLWVGKCLIWYGISSVDLLFFCEGNGWWHVKLNSSSIEINVYSHIVWVNSVDEMGVLTWKRIVIGDHYKS